MQRLLALLAVFFALPAFADTPGSCIWGVNCESGGVSAIPGIAKHLNGDDWYLQREDFDQALANLTAIQTVGWSNTNVGSPTGNSSDVTETARYMTIFAGFTVDTGMNIELSAAPTATTVHEHRNVGPILATTTLMDNRALFMEARVAFYYPLGSAAWNSKVAFGWFGLPDNSVMVPATGVLDSPTANGASIFHIGEDGALSYNSTFPGDVAHTSLDMSFDVPSVGAIPTTPVVGSWFTVGFKQVYVDASDSADNGYTIVYLNGNEVGLMTNKNPMSTANSYGFQVELLNGPSNGVVMAIDWIVTGISRYGVTVQ